MSFSKSGLKEWSEQHAARMKANHDNGLDVVVRTFEITRGEMNRADEWLTSHRAGDDCTYKKNVCPTTGEPFYMGAIGGGLTYSFTPTGLGSVVKAKCACGAETDITDYESW